MESGWASADLAPLSPAKLLWIHRRHNAASVHRDLRALMIAAAAQSRDGIHELNRMLMKELQAFSSEVAGSVQTPVSQTPTSAEEFQRMMRTE